LGILKAGSEIYKGKQGRGVRAKMNEPPSKGGRAGLSGKDGAFQGNRRETGLELTKKNPAKGKEGVSAEEADADCGYEKRPVIYIDLDDRVEQKKKLGAAAKGGIEDCFQTNDYLPKRPVQNVSEKRDLGEEDNAAASTGGGNLSIDRAKRSARERDETTLAV